MNAGRAGNDAEGGCYFAWHIPVLYFKAGEEDNEAAEKGVD